MCETLQLSFSHHDWEDIIKSTTDTIEECPSISDKLHLQRELGPRIATLQAEVSSLDVTSLAAPTELAPRAVRTSSAGYVAAILMQLGLLPAVNAASANKTKFPLDLFLPSDFCRINRLMASPGEPPNGNILGKMFFPRQAESDFTSMKAQGYMGGVNYEALNQGQRGTFM